MSAHDRFESLAGAVMLGEATPAEREAFAAHAATCAACRDDAADGALVTERIALAHGSERWRPAQPIVERLRSRRSTRARATLGALGWAVALSLVLNVAFVSGVGARLGSALAPVGTGANVASTPIELEIAPRPHATAIAPVAAPRTHLAMHVMRAFAHRARAVDAALPHKRVTAAPHEPTLDDVPDPLAGIDLYGDGTPRRAVARVTLPRCSARADDSAADVRPCLDAAGRIDR